MTGTPRRSGTRRLLLAAGAVLLACGGVTAAAYTDAALVFLGTGSEGSGIGNPHRFDIAVLYHAFGVMAEPVFCTKIASRLTRTYTDRHGLKDICNELLGVSLSKQQQSSDWAAEVLSPEQLEYAASDVLYLHRLRDVLAGRLARDGRTKEAEACFRFLPTRAKLDLMGWGETDIFAHS